MRIRIERIDASGAIVSISSPAGQCRGRWKNRTVPPLINREYDVELDVETTLILGTTVFPAAEQRCYISIVDDDTVVFNGLVEAVDPDGMAYQRIATDCLIMLQFDSSPPKTGQWVQTSVSAALVTIHANAQYDMS